MPITLVGSQTAGIAGTNTAQTITFALTGGSNTVPQAGDLVIVSYAIAGTSDLNLTIKTAGAVDYTLLGTEQYRDDTNDANMRTAYRVMPGTPDTTVVLSETAGGTGSTNNGGSYTVFVYRGVHATLLEQAVQQGVQFDTMLVNPGSITPTTTGTLIHVVGSGAIGTGGVYTSGDLTGFISATSVAVSDSNIGAGYKAWTSGAFDPAAFGGGGTDTTLGSAAWMVIALAPAAATSTRPNKLIGLIGRQQPISQ